MENRNIKSENYSIEELENANRVTYQVEYFRKMPLKSQKKPPNFFHSNAGIFLIKAETSKRQNKQPNLYEVDELCKNQNEGF